MSEWKERDTERAIVAIRKNEIPHIWDFAMIGESDEEAENRAFFASMGNMELYASHHKNFPTIQPDGSEYWENQYKAEEEREYKVMSFDDFQALEKKMIIDMPMTEITAERFNEMLNVLPPKAWTTHDGVEMFCMSEFYTGTYTTQCAHDHRTGKYYEKLVDITDRNTWIVEYLR